MRRGDHMEVRETSRTHSPLVFHLNHVGRHVGWLETGVGRAYLAFCPDKERQRVLELLQKSGGTPGLFMSRPRSGSVARAATTGPSNTYPRLGTVFRTSCLSSPMARRTSLMQRVKESSVTATFGQIALISCSFETTRPACCKRYRSTSKHVQSWSAYLPTSCRNGAMSKSVGQCHKRSLQAAYVNALSAPCDAHSRVAKRWSPVDRGPVRQEDNDHSRSPRYRCFTGYVPRTFADTPEGRCQCPS